MDATVFIAGFGACTPVGYDAVMTVTSVRAGIKRAAAHPYMIERSGASMVVCKAGYLPDDLPAPERLAALALPALEESLAPLAAQTAAAGKPPLFLGLSGPRPGWNPETIKAFTARLARTPFVRQMLGAVRVFAEDHTAGCAALEAGCRAIANGQCACCLAGGLDSYLFPETLQWLDDTGRLHSRLSTWGFVPGEGAGFCLLARGSGDPAVPFHGRIAGYGAAVEDQRFETHGTCTGLGLTTAVKAAMQGLSPDRKIDFCVSDYNGERHRSAEYGFMLSRICDCLKDPSQVLILSQSLGDVGAAFAPLAVMLAADAARQNHGKGPLSLIWAGSPGGERKALLLDMQERNPPSWA